MENHTIYLVLSDTGTLFTRIIKWYTKKPYNHASISFETDLKVVYSFGRKRPANPFIGGFVKENVRGGFYEEAVCAIYACRVTTEQLKKMKAFIGKIEQEQEFYRYNLLGVLAIMLNKPLERKRHFFCSQFVAAVLNKGDVKHFQKPPSQIKPHELVEDIRFQLVFCGQLKHFCRKTEAYTDRLNREYAVV